MVSKARLEALVDGIFAIAMTILVLELEVPQLEDRRSTAELAQALLRNAIGFGSYLLGFLLLGVFWAAHNACYRFIQRITKGILALQLLQLAAAAFLPYCVALVGRHGSVNPVAFVVYMGCIAAYVWAGTLLLSLAWRAGALVPAADIAVFRRIKRGMLGFSIAISLLLTLYLVAALIN